MDQAEAKHLFEPTGDFQCLHEFLPAARAKLSDHIWGYLVGATETETTLRRNRLAIDSLALRPRRPRPENLSALRPWRQSVDRRRGEARGRCRLRRVCHYRRHRRLFPP